MSNVIGFPKEKVVPATNDRGKSNKSLEGEKGASATILLFTGVQYQREVDTHKPKPAVI